MQKTAQQKTNGTSGVSRLSSAVKKRASKADPKTLMAAALGSGKKRRIVRLERRK